MLTNTTRPQADQDGLAGHEEAKRLFESSKKLAPFVLGRVFPHLQPDDKEDYLSAAYLGLWRAALRFDPTTRNAFSSYAVSMVRGYLLNEHRRRRKQERVLCFSLDTPVREELSQLDFTAAPAPLCDPFTILNRRARLHKALQKWQRKSPSIRERHPKIEAEVRALEGKLYVAATPARR